MKVLWQDGLYKYQPGMVVELPDVLARGYIGAGKASPSNPPKWATQTAKENNAKKIPSARRRIKRMSTIPQQELSLKDLANQVLEDD